VAAGGLRNNYENITVTGFYICIDVQNGAIQNFHNCFITNPVLYGIKRQNILSVDSGDDSISNCAFYAGASGRTPTSAIRIESGGGTKITNCKINALDSTHPWVNGIDLSVASGVGTSDLLVSNCSIESYSGAGIKATNAVGAGFENIVITGNQFFPATSGSPYGINVSGSNPGDFNGVCITGNFGNTNVGGSGVAFIALKNCSNAIISGNGHDGGFTGILYIDFGVTFSNAATYVGRDARLVPISGGVAVEARNVSTGAWVEKIRWTNP
jgi:hypothetical protein